MIARFWLATAYFLLALYALLSSNDEFEVLRDYKNNLLAELNKWQSVPDSEGWWWLESVHGIRTPALVKGSYAQTWQREHPVRIDELKAAKWCKAYVPEEK
jgi:hypothetical protein